MPSSASCGRRVLVVGISGAGKTTLARQLAQRLGLRHIEVDSLFHGPGWVPRPRFESDVQAATRGDGWIADSGDYRQVRDLLWERADTVIWLDYTRWVVMTRVLRRSLARATFHRRLWNGNTEGFTDWLDAEHPIRWAWSEHRRRRRQTAQRLADPRWSSVRVVRLASPRSARRWLAAVQPGQPGLSVCRSDRADPGQPHPAPG